MGQTDIGEIRLMYKAAFAKDATPNAKYKTMPMQNILELNNHNLLGTAIVGKNDSARDALPTKETKYFVLRKQDEQTMIEFYKKNPISTSFELIWEEVNRGNINSTAIILNVMRQILEHYFSIIGGIDYERCVNAFDGENKLICKSLISFI